MGVYIKGMEMPKSCETCELSSTDSSGFFGCCVTGNIVLRKREQDKPLWCPLVPIPPHGRLIDIDRLLLEVNSLTNSEKSILQIVSETEKLIRNVPIVVESEEEDA